MVTVQLRDGTTMTTTIAGFTGTLAASDFVLAQWHDTERHAQPSGASLHSTSRTRSSPDFISSVTVLPASMSTLNLPLFIAKMLA